MSNSRARLVAVFCCLIVYLPRIPSASVRVVGGMEASDYYPYQASLQILTDVTIFRIIKTGRKMWSHNCGGSILTERHIVTAAHCIVNQQLAELSVVVGTNDLSSGGGGVRFQVATTLVHPDYVELQSSDIGLIQVDAPFQFSDMIKAIQYSSDIIGGGVDCILTGWGYTTNIRLGGVPKKLQQLVVPTITNEECNRMGLAASSTEICTFSRFGKGSCGGDSGGPLAHANLLVGIVSYGTSICAVGAPDAFTRVSQFAQWINKNTYS